MVNDEPAPDPAVLAGLALALTWGGMTFFSAVMAPLVFTKLPFETAGAFIREVFPWYYLAMGLTTLLAVLLLLPGVGAGVGWPAALSAFALAGFVMAQVLMPGSTRRATRNWPATPTPANALSACTA